MLKDTFGAAKPIIAMAISRRCRDRPAMTGSAA